MRAIATLFALLLCACSDEPENIQTRAENLSRQLEQQAAEISAEAENDASAASAPLDNEADALLNQIGDNGADGNAAP
jgi:membrane carboxypeptidase/penicillin-binding protein PbpC